MSKLLTLLTLASLSNPAPVIAGAEVGQKSASEADLQQMIASKLAADGGVQSNQATVNPIDYPNFPAPSHPIGDPGNKPFQWYSPTNTEDGGLNAWANDPATILYDEDSGLYYSWMLFRNGRGFPSGWIEMTSPDMNNWTQTTERIKEGREFFAKSFDPSAMGGSVWLDREGQYFDKGDLIFAISMQDCTLMGGASMTGDSGIAYYVSHGFGQPIYKAGIITPQYINPTGTDWRDSFLYNTDDGLYFAIAADTRVEFWRINSFNESDITKVGEIYVRSIGVEVPNVVRFGENEWYVSCSIQDAHLGGPYQSCEWFLCHMEGETFVPYSKGFHEYGTEGYAERVVNPFQSRIAEFAISRSMAANWTYNTDIWSWKGGCYGSEKMVIRGDRPYLEPYDLIGDFQDNGTYVYKVKASDLANGYTLHFDKGDFIFYYGDDRITWDNQVVTNLSKWTTIGGEAAADDDITIIINKCTLTFYDEWQGWNAHFMLPEAVVHVPNHGVMSLLPSN